MKTCSRCKKEYPSTKKYWFSGKQNKDGLRGVCKRCCVERNREYRKKNIKVYEPKADIKKTCSKCGNAFPITTEYWFKLKIGKYGLRSICKTCFTEETKRFKKTLEYKKKAKEYNKKHYADNKEQYSERYKKYYQENIEWMQKRARIYAKNNLTKRRKWDEIRRKSPQYRISSNMSRSIRQSLIRYKNKNGAHWEELVDYDRHDLIKHLENQFEDNMSWDNYGKWHIDHIIPISVFNFTKPEHDDFKRCWSLSNLQPMWAKENISKGDKLKKPFQPGLAI